MKTFRAYWPWMNNFAFDGLTVCYGEPEWPSYSRWITPGTYVD
jgi:hypothetical protein